VHIILYQSTFNIFPKTTTKIDQHIKSRYSKTSYIFAKVTQNIISVPTHQPKPLTSCIAVTTVEVVLWYKKYTQYHSGQGEN